MSRRRGELLMTFSSPHRRALSLAVTWAILQPLLMMVIFAVVFCVSPEMTE